jgi:ATP-dependent helicase HrpA
VTDCAHPSPEDLRRAAAERGICFDENLPVSAHWVEIAQALIAHPVLIVCGETGSGKTTQLPKIALAAGRAAKGKSIAHTQPRRIAATSVARRIAQELKTACGPQPDANVGYKIRFSDQSRRGQPIVLMTDGLLLAESQADPLLRRYDTIIIDEAHERSLNIDFLLGYLKQLLRRRPELRVIITSATLDAQKFAQHFAQGAQPAPVFEVSGRLYPVETLWRPASDDRQDLVERVVAGVEEGLSLARGGDCSDLLVFLPGEREIRAVADALTPIVRNVDILPLFARLAQGDQNKIFKPTGRQRVVLATNIAETSLTVPGIRVVVDTGLARVKRYRIKGKVEQLQIEPISQAQANQRAGRAGRLAPGICIRLFSEDDFRGRPEHPDPEIHRSSLASVILRMKALGLTDIDQFPFVDPPSKRAITDGLALLRELQAIDGQGALTEVGRDLADLPLDPRLARMLVEAKTSACLREMIVLVSALSCQDPRERPLDQQQAADTAHKRFADERSEFKSWIRLWDWIQDAFESKASNRKLDQSLRTDFLSPLRVREWRDLHRQVHDWVLARGWRENDQHADDLRLHQAILTGLLSNVGCRIDESGKVGHVWAGTHDIKFSIWPGSFLAKKPPRWLMAAEQVDTSRLYARTIAAIEPESIERAAAHLIKLSYSEPHWEKKAGRAVGYARGTLYGLPIYARRRVAWARLGPEQAKEARALLIREGLVGQEIECGLPFYRHNLQLMREVERMEHKARRQDLLVDEGLIEAFYEAHLPEGVVDVESLESWWRKASRQQPKLLYLTKSDLMRHEAAGITTDQFPRQMAQQGLSLALDYRFEPGEVQDGLQVSVPVSALNQLQADRLDWLVPGMLKEKVLALLKSLPQRMRRQVLPLEEVVQTFCETWRGREGDKPLVRALIEHITQVRGVSVGVDDFKRETLAPHLTAWVKVLDEHGRLLGQGRNLQALKDAHGQRATAALAPVQDDTVHRSWTFGPLEPVMEIERAGQQLCGYPALEDAGDGVRLRLLDDPDKARAMHGRGLARLFALAAKEQVRALERDLQKNRELSVGWVALGEREGLVDQISLLAIRRAFLSGPWPHDSTSFEATAIAGRSRLMLIAQESTRWLHAVIQEWTQVQRRLAALKASDPVSQDIQEQVQRLMPKGFVLDCPDERAKHLPRYLKAISLRLDKRRSDPARDDQRMAEVRAVELPFWRWVRAQRGAWSEEAIGFRWLLEELRVASFAQELKTPVPVSVKRLQKTWSTLSVQV